MIFNARVHRQEPQKVPHPCQTQKSSKVVVFSIRFYIELASQQIQEIQPASQPASRPLIFVVFLSRLVKTV